MATKALKVAKGENRRVLLAQVPPQYFEASNKRLKALSAEKAFEIAVAAGIYTKSGKLAAPYRSK